jgi:hypothetical protein
MVSIPLTDPSQPRPDFKRQLIESALVSVISAVDRCPARGSFADQAEADLFCSSQFFVMFNFFVQSAFHVAIRRGTEAGASRSPDIAGCVPTSYAEL